MMVEPSMPRDTRVGGPRFIRGAAASARLRSPAVPLPDIQDLRPADLATWCADAGEPAFRARQVLGWVHRKAVADFAGMTDVSRGLRERLAGAFRLERLRPAQIADARDGTRKLLFQLDGEGTASGRPAAIESVLIPQVDRADGARDRLTLCISSQAGCGMGCGFCATAQLGLIRNLRPAEIVGQVHAAMALATPAPLTNIVLMGMGEPLANYEAVAAACEILTAEWGYAISPRRITVSTVGLAPLIPKFIAETRVNLAVSLHAPTDAQRERLVPVNRRYPLAALMAACREVPLPRRKRITFEYVMLAGENDADADARALVRLLHGLPSKVNLIPWNPFPGCTFTPSPRARVQRFQALLHAQGINATIRESRGQDIMAACGQLATSAA
jgi:23S rRNA (adenine2503-C2)-methyltransferase